MVSTQRAALLLACALTITNPMPASGQEAKPIFNGTNLEGWKGAEKFWSVRDGAITGETTPENPTPGNTFLVWQGGDLDDFELSLQFRIDAGNSGIQYRSEHLGNFVIKGYQADIDAEGGYLGINYEERGRGILAGRGEKVHFNAKGERKVVGSLGDAKALVAGFKKGQWHEYFISARGPHLIQKINGKTVVDILDDSPQGKRSGVLALQLHAGPPMKIQFKNIRLKRLRLEKQKKLVMVAGTASHGYGAHEFNAGCLLLQKLFARHYPGLHTSVYLNGWPKDATAFDNADGILLFMNGGGGHPVNQHLDEVDKLMSRGVGLACMHFAVEVPKGKPGERFLAWLGGYFETFFSVNPHWTLDKTKVASDHPIGRGVKPFSVNDEWYYHMRFRESKDVTPILSALPPENTRNATPSERGGNPRVAARKGMHEVVAWAVERPDGGRGFGFTGGHDHWNWANDDYRKLVLNALVWVSGAEVPTDGVASPCPTPDEMTANIDEPRPAQFDRVQLERVLRRAATGK